MGDKKKQNRRKKHQNQKHIIDKSKEQKRKTRLTREYQETENEVQCMLENTRLTIDAAAEMNSELLLQHDKFFCGSNGSLKETTHSAETEATNTATTTAPEALWEMFTNENEDETSSEDEDDDRRDSSAGNAISQRSSERDTQIGTVKSASSYIQIELEPAVTHWSTAQPMQLYPEILCSRKKVQMPPISKVLKDERPTFYRTLTTHQFHPIFCAPTHEPQAIPTRKYLKIQLLDLRFTEHAQLQQEHRLANDLEDLYNTYAQRRDLKVCEQIRAQLQIERKIVNDLMQRESQYDGEVTNSEAIMQRTTVLAQHCLAVRTLRNKLGAEEMVQKHLQQQLLEMWTQLKKLRKQQTPCTRFRLRLHVRECDTASERSAWMQRYDTELNEIYREELEIYYSKRRSWQQQQQSVGDNQKRPKKPNIERLSQKLQESLAACTRKPGEPNIEIYSARIRDDDVELQTEMRSDSTNSYFMKLYFDSQLVGMTRSYRLEPDLRLAINEVLGIVLDRRLPKDIQIKLYEKTSLLHLPQKLANLIVPLPLDAEAAATTEQCINFSSHKTKQPLSGRLRLCFSCDERIYSENMVKVLFPAPAERTQIPTHILRDWREKHTLLEVVNRTTDMEDKAIKPNDSDLEEDEDTAAENLRKLATCTFAEDTLRFCDISEIDENPRFKILLSRYQQHDPRTKDLCFVPALPQELEFTINDEVADDIVLDVGNWMDAIDLHKHEGKKYLRQLYEAVRNQCIHLSKLKESEENLFLGYEPPSISSFFRAVSRIFTPTRFLNPQRNVPTAASTIMMDNEESLGVNHNIKIILNIVRATGIPVRSGARSAQDGDSRKRSSGGSSSLFLSQQNFKYSNIRPFIALGYKDKLSRTLTAEGSNPTWNERLTLQLSSSLADLRDDIKISLFDEVIEQHINDDGTTRHMDLYQRLQAHWLGEYRIPISTILAMYKIEGVLEFNIPHILLGYQRPTFDGIISSNAVDTSIMLDQMPEIKRSVHVWFHLSIEPSLPLPRVRSSCMECAELRDLRQHLEEWTVMARQMQPQRFIDPLVGTVDGKRLSATRLLEACPLPVEASENLLDSALRFVAQLNVYRGFDACTKFDGIWLNNQIVLDTTWGSAKDLGILLANYILSLGITCSVVLCNAHPHGQSAFVLYSLEKELMLADPCTGRRYAVGDIFCPISKVDCIISQDNIYINIQSEKRIAMLNFNVNDASCWLPAFNKRHPAPTGGVQKLNYKYTDAFSTIELRKNIERKIMKKISAWRSMRKTIWNRAFQTRLLSILQTLEASATFVSETNSNLQHDKYVQQLAAEFPRYTFRGFTLNFSYTNLSAVSERIKATGIHLNSHKNVEFSVAVHIHAYANNVLSVWIFLTSVVPL